MNINSLHKQKYDYWLTNALAAHARFCEVTIDREKAVLSKIVHYSQLH